MEGPPLGHLSSERVLHESPGGRIPGLYRSSDRLPLAICVSKLTGTSQEAHNKTIVLVNQTFTANDIDAMLRFLYTAKLQEHHLKDPVKTFVVGAYFHIKNLRDVAIYRIKKGLESYIETGYWRNWRKLAVQFLTEFQGTEIEQALVQVTAFHARSVIHQPLVMWDELIAAHPSFANQVLKQAFPKPAEPQPTMVKSSAFDDARRAN